MRRINMENVTKNIKEQLENAGYDYAVAIATEAEIQAGAACGQLSIIIEEEEQKK
jgi:adenine C2-methylase RlmN of 23S rRNA A2503 and tRNA A37